jgi:hypothetical protein
MMLVGPVIQACSLGRAVVDSLLALNHGCEVVDRGSYYRVLSPGRCVLTRREMERRTGEKFRLPGDRELVMPSFQGTIRITEESAEWRETEARL